MKKILIVCCLLLIATSLFAVELKPYKYSNSSYFKMIDENSGVSVLGETLTSGYVCQTTGFILFNLNNEYNELVLTVGVSDNYSSTSPSKVHFYVDGVKVKTVSVNAESMPEEIIVPLNYKRQLKVYTEYYHEYDHKASVVLTNLDFR